VTKVASGRLSNSAGRNASCVAAVAHSRFWYDAAVPDRRAAFLLVARNGGPESARMTRVGHRVRRNRALQQALT
jgi:hypothetical protein